MHMLESAMAFAVVMIIFSTIVTGLVQAFLRAVSLRKRTLKHSLALFIQDEVKPQLLSSLKQTQAAVQTLDKAADDVEAMVASFTANPIKADRDSWLSRVLAKRLERIDELTAYSFLQRLAKSDLSATIRQMNDDQLNNYLANVMRTYDRYMAASTEFYRKKSHILTVMVAMTLAAVFNVPAARVYMHLMDNPETRAELINAADNAIEANRAAEERLREFWHEQGVIARQAADPAAQPTDQPQPSTDDMAARKEVAKQITDLRNTLESLRTDTGLPNGPSMWPFCYGERSAALSECSAAAEAERGVWSYIYWAFNVALAGVLIGLGGPFWAKVYTRLAQFAGRPLSKGGNPELVAPDAGGDATKKAADNPAAAFRIAAGEVTYTP